MKLLVEVMGKNNLAVLDEILHPDYFSEQYVTDKDRFWNKISSNLLAFEYRSKTLRKDVNIEEGTVRKTGIEAAKVRFDKNREDFPLPDAIIEIHYLVEEGNCVVALYTISYFHDKNYYNVDPTNQEIKYNGVHLFSFSDGKIVKMINLRDTYQLLSDLGDIVMNQGDKKQIQQYMEMLKRQNLIPHDMSD